MKNKLIYILAFFCMLSYSCDSDNDDAFPEGKLDPHLRTGYINIHCGENKIELKEITVYPYLNSERDTLGLVYTGYMDEMHLLSKNGVALYISRDSRLIRIHYYYSKPGTNYATLFLNNEEDYDNEATLLEHHLYVDGTSLKGRFNGILFNPFESLNIDNCEFEISR